MAHIMAHMQLLSLFVQEAGEIQPTSIDQGAEQHRSALDSALTKYTKEHFPNGVVTVSAMCDCIIMI